MIAEIQNYRGINIWFDTHNETFNCDIDDDRSVKKSYNSVIKFIDDYLKDNQNFRSFSVEKNPISSWGGKSGRIIGIRKDNRFIFLPKDGDKKEQISEYNEKEFILLDERNKPFWKELEEIDMAFDELQAKKKEIKEKFYVKTLAEYKKELLNK